MHGDFPSGTVNGSLLPPKGIASLLLCLVLHKHSVLSSLQVSLYLKSGHHFFFSIDGNNSKKDEYVYIFFQMRILLWLFHISQKWIFCFSALIDIQRFFFLNLFYWAVQSRAIIIWSTSVRFTKNRHPLPLGCPSVLWITNQTSQKRQPTVILLETD